MQLRSTPGFVSWRVRRSCNESISRQARQFAVHVADAQPDSGSLPVRFHQRIAVRGVSVRKQGEQHVPKHERAKTYLRPRNCVKGKTARISAYIVGKTEAV